MKRAAIDLAEDINTLIDDWARAEVAAVRAQIRVRRRLSDAQWDHEYERVAGWSVPDE